MGAGNADVVHGDVLDDWSEVTHPVLKVRVRSVGGAVFVVVTFKKSESGTCCCCCDKHNREKKNQYGELMDHVFSFDFFLLLDEEETRVKEY